MTQMIAKMFIIMTLAFEAVILFGGATAPAFIVSIAAAVVFAAASYFANKNSNADTEIQANEQEKMAA